MKKIVTILSALAMLVSTALIVAPPAHATARDDCDVHQIIGFRTITGTHNGVDYNFLLCVTAQYEAGAWFVWTHLKYDGASTVPGNVHSIDIVKMHLMDNINGTDYQVSACDQNSGANNDDGSGCDYGKYSAGSGPCAGFWQLSLRGKAQGSSGCDANTYEKFSQTDKFDDPGGHDTYWGEVWFQVQFNDGTYSNERDLTVQQDSCPCL